MNLQLLSGIKVRNKLLLFCILLFQLQILQAHPRTSPPDQEVLLTEAIQQISRKYQVLFSYDRAWVDNIVVEYNETSTDNLEDALEFILSQANLAYQIFDDRYVAVYRDTDEGMASLQKMVEHFQGIVDHREMMRKRQVEALAPIHSVSTKDLYNKRLVINVTGQIVDEDGLPLIGVNVLVKGSDKGTSTDLNGNFLLEDMDENATLVISYIGYQTMEVLVAGKSQIKIVLLNNAQMLKEVVVTAMNVERDKDNLGYAVQNIKGEAIQEGGNPNVLNALSGKISGVNISQNPGISGSTRILIRGESSINGNNQPLFVVDGIPINNEIISSAGANVDFGNGIMDIAPSNIESINVLKGPNAAALYGSRAANGAIIITTKKGNRFKPFTVELSSSLSMQNVLRLPDYQNNWGGGKGPEYSFVNGNGTGGGIDGQGVNYGPKLNELDPTTASGYVERIQFGSPIDPTTGERIAIPWVAYPNNVKDFFNTGTTQDNNIAVSGGFENGNYRVSFANTDQVGTVPNTDYKRKSLTSSLNFDIGKRLSISTNLNYINAGSDNVPSDGYSRSLMYMFLWFYRNVDIDWAKDYWLPGREGYEQSNFETNWVNNVYFQVNENRNSYRKDRGIGNIVMDFEILPSLDLTLRSNMDIFRNTQETRVAIGDRYSPNGMYTKKDIFFNEVNNEFLLTYSKDVNKKVDMSLAFGGNQRKFTQNLTTGQAPGLNIPFIYNFGNSSGEVLNTQFDSEKQVNSLYGFANFSFFDGIHIDLTARNDWSSALTRSDGTGNNSYFYPSASLSAVLSELVELPKMISYLKLRGSWAQVGNDTDPYQLRPTFVNDVSWGGIPTVNESSTIYNSNLKPEIITSQEAGIEMSLFDSRVSLDYTFYNSNAKNQILAVPVPLSSGYNNKIINAGEIKSWGSELSLNANLIKAEKLKWNLGLNWMTTKSKVISLAPGINNYIMYSNWSNTVEARVGEYMGDMYGLQFEKSPEGEIIYYNGLPKLDSEKIKIGNYNPDWKAGIHSQLQYGGISLGVLFDYQHGGIINSMTHGRGVHAGSLTNSGEMGNVRLDGIVGDGVMVAGDGTFVPNTVVAPTFDFVRQSANYNNIEVNSFDATYLKLREAHITYTFSKDLLTKIFVKKASIGLYGNNLLLFTQVPHIDPDNIYQEGGKFRTGFEVMQLPSSRTMGVRLNLVF